MKIKWKVIEKHFNSSDLLVSKQEDSFAQGPQSIVLSDRVRVFFSYRTSDKPGFFKTHVAFFDFDLSLSKIIDRSKREVMSLGDLGSYYEHGIFPFHVIKVGEKCLAYVSGWSRKSSVSVDTSIGLAVGNQQSDVFLHAGSGPVLTACVEEPFLVCDPNVVMHNGIFHMWYIFGTRWKLNREGTPERTYKIGYAVSDNGFDWKRPNPGLQIITSKSIDEAQAMPSVIQIRKELFIMCFCYRDSFDFRKGGDGSYKLGGAISRDLINWERNDKLFEMYFPSWASTMQCYPHLQIVGDELILFFNGNEFGKYGFGYAHVPLKEFDSVS